jgi:FkbH-like protein
MTLAREKVPGLRAVAPGSSDSRKVTVGLVGNTITQPLGKIAALAPASLQLAVRHYDFGQAVQVLMAADPMDFLIVHLDHRWFFDIAPHQGAVARAQELVELAEQWLSRTGGVILLNTVPYLPTSPISTDLLEQLEALAALNGELIRFGRRHERAQIVDVAGILARRGYAASLRERNRLLIQHPYGPEAISDLLQAYGAAIFDTFRARRKVIVLDADNTLWGGVLGEDGIEGIRVDQEYPGVLYLIFQKQLARLKDLGFLLCVVTKNNESDFLELFKKRQMPLRLDDFAAWRSNWQEKSTSIASLAEQLNLGLDSFVFIDDNPFEIEEVRARCPGVECHLFPKGDPEAILSLVDGMASLRAHALTAEDRVKTEQYKIETQRQSLKQSSGSLDDYLASLEIQIIVSVNADEHVARIAQLTNKTNQFNLTTKRYTEADVRRFMASGRVYDFRVVDRFGDMGIVGVVIVDHGNIDTFLMSCRALGRKIEAGILHHIVEDHQAEVLKASYRPTAKNGMVADFYDQNGFARIDVSDEAVTYVCKEGPNANRHFQLVRD